MTARQYCFVKWVCYSLSFLLILFLQSLLLSSFRVLGTTPFLLPVLVCVSASYEGWRQGGIYALLVGLLADLLLTSGPFPAFYTLGMTLAALTAAAIAKYRIAPGFLCSLTASLAGFTVLLLVRLFVAGLEGTAPLPLLIIGGKECLLSLPFALPVNWLFARISRKFALD